MEVIFEFIGEVVAVGGAAAVIAYGIFVFFGKKWLETKFSERLEAYKHKQNKELEEVRYKINAQFNRISKIHEKEMEVLPEAWHKLHYALGKIQYFTSPLREYQDLDRLTEEQLEAFLDSSKFHDWEKNELRKTEGKLEYYQERIFYHELAEAKKASSEFHNYIVENSIFLSQDIKERFIAIDDALWDSLMDKETNHESKGWGVKRKSYSQVKKDIAPLTREIESLVQKRLQLDEAI